MRNHLKSHHLYQVKRIYAKGFPRPFYPDKREKQKTKLKRLNESFQELSRLGIPRLAFGSRWENASVDNLIPLHPIDFCLSYKCR